MKNAIKKNLLDIFTLLYTKIFLKKSFFKLNKLLFYLSLKGMGILNYENDKLSGEEFFIKKISGLLKNSVVVDVGANIGNYSNQIISLAPSTKIYAFEPHPKTFSKLEIQANKHNYVALNAACSDAEGNLKLYDYQGDRSGSSHASLYQDVIDKIHQGVSESWDVNVTTIDEFVKLYKILQIRLLKIDTEGNEMKVLLGAEQTIRGELIDIIQFEFSQLNVVTRVFFKDIHNILPNYLFYRMLPDGLVSLVEYYPIDWEIFAYQNIIAIRKSFIEQVRNYLDV